MSVIDEIAAERKRQIEVEGWSPRHDDRHEFGELAGAASAYALKACLEESSAGHLYNEEPPNEWPFDKCWWRPKDTRHNLIRAAALIVAEIERLDRQAEPLQEPPVEGETPEAQPVTTEGEG